METVYSLGKMKYETRRIKPYFHSRMLVDPKILIKCTPDMFLVNMMQFQQNGKVSYIINEKKRSFPEVTSYRRNCGSHRE